MDIYFKTSGTSNYITLRVKDANNSRQYVNAWNAEVFESFGLTGDMKSIFNSLLEFVGKNLTLVIKIARKRGANDLPVVYYSLFSINQ